jgi:Mor family transcriptional regulator
MKTTLPGICVINGAVKLRKLVPLFKINQYRDIASKFHISIAWIVTVVKRRTKNVNKDTPTTLLVTVVWN